jgi:CubicO group peptidase (beta-lactamase class C family)
LDYFLVKKILTLIFLFFSFQSFSYEWERVEKLIGANQNGLYTQSDTLVGSFYEIHFDLRTKDNQIYDLASLTKVIATTTAVMILHERGELNLGDKLSKFFSGLNTPEKKTITIEDLLRHQAGLKSGLPFLKDEKYQAYIKRILNEPLRYSPRSGMVYSDLGFILLGIIVEKVSGQSLEEFCQKEIFLPLQMNDTSFNPFKKSLRNCAPTLKSRVCLAHDPTASNFYRHSLGHAGLFSTTSDLATFAKMLLNGGVFGSSKVLSRESIELMITLPQGKQRGLGWDISSDSATNPRGDYFPEGLSFGHIGFTGTTLWIDPISKNFYIFLSNRTYLGDAQTRAKFREFRKTLSNEIGKVLFAPSLL